MKRVFLALVAVLVLGLTAQAETLKKRYTFDYQGGASRRASEARAQTRARKQFLQDFLADKFSKDIVENLREEIDIALDPAEEYLVGFEVKSSRVNPEETQITLTVEGDVNLPAMVTALVNNDVLSFGERPPKVMFLPSSRFDNPKAAKTLRALLFDKLKQAKLQPVAFEGITEVTSVQGKVTPDSIRILAKKALEYRADYLIYVDVEADNRPASVGGYLCDANFIYTIMRPNDNQILGESVVSERGSGNSAMLAFDRVLDAAAPTILTQGVGQLFRSIFSDSDVIYDTKQLKNSYQMTVYFKDNPGQTQAIIKGLQGLGARVELDMGGAADRMTIETTMELLDLYNYFNDQTFDAPNGKFKTPVIDYGENTIGVEIVKLGAAPKKQPQKTPPARKAKPRPTTGQAGGQTGGQTAAKEKPKIVLNLKGAIRPPGYVQ